MDRINPFDFTTMAPVYGANNLWQNGNPAVGDEGSIPPAEALVHPQEEIVNVIEQAGLTPDDGDLTQLWQALQKIIARDPLPFYPEILTNDAKLTVTDIGSGNIRIAAGETFMHRGGRVIKTDDYDQDTERTFAVAGNNKDFHLRWQWNAGTPAFVLEDLNSAGYNPTTLDEWDPAFDTGFDDMLIARVKTDGGGAISTITTLANKRQLLSITTDTDLSPSPSGANGATGTFHVQTRWGRTPTPHVSVRRAVTNDPITDVDLQVFPGQTDRYGIDATVRWDFATEIEVSIMAQSLG